MRRQSRAFAGARLVRHHVPSLPRRAPGARKRGAAPRLSLVLVARLVPLALCVAVLAPRTARAEPQVSDVDRQIAAASGRLETLVEQHNAVRSDLAATRARSAATSDRVADVARGIDQARERVSAIAVWAYKTGPTTGVGAMLTAGSPKALISRLIVIQDLARSDQRDISELTDRTRSLDAERVSLHALEVQQARQEAELGTLTEQVERDLVALRVLRDRIGTTSRRSPATLDKRAAAVTPSPPAKDATGRAVAFAYAQLGRPYTWGAGGPDSYDCSGLTSAAWRAAGVSLPHNAARQYSAMAHVSRNQLQPGDLVFYYRDLHHVGIYVGDGNVVHAPNTGERVRVQRMEHAPIQGYGRPS
jgi:cell wall-associated NlpC family hydrolase